MTKYLKIEYLIAPDGKITERVINGSGNECLDTAAIALELGQIEKQELLPSYYDADLSVSPESINLQA
jgi:hypothetical protein